MATREWTGKTAALAVTLIGASLLPNTTPTRADGDAPPGMKASEDPKGYVTIDLPRGTTVVGPDAKDPAQLQRWGLNWNEEPGSPFAYLYVKHVPGYARASLCGWVRGRERNGERIVSTVAFGEHDYWETRNYEGKGFMRYRVIEHQGQCFEAYVHASTRNFESASAQFEAILATLRGRGAAPEFALPTGFKKSEIEGRVVFSNAKKKRDAQRIAKLHKKAWETMAEALPGEPFDDSMPRIDVCADEASYRSRWSGKGGPSPFCFVDTNSRALVVLVAKRRDADFEQAVYRSTCLQYIRAYFGGHTPPWIEEGLRMYGTQGVVANGKFDQPYKKTIKTARTAAERRNATLAEIFELGKADIVDRNNRDHELYAWHWYFRHGPGREKYGDLYDRHLATLRESGDVLAARKVWENANMEDLRAGFQEWIATWRD